MSFSFSLLCNLCYPSLHVRGACLHGEDGGVYLVRRRVHHMCRQQKTGWRDHDFQRAERVRVENKADMTKNSSGKPNICRSLTLSRPFEKRFNN